MKLNLGQVNLAKCLHKFLKGQVCKAQDEDRLYEICNVVLADDWLTCGHQDLLELLFFWEWLEKSYLGTDLYITVRLVYCLYIYNIGYTPVRQDQLLSSYCQGSSVLNAGDTLLIVSTGNKTNWNIFLIMKYIYQIYNRLSRDSNVVCIFQ